MGIFIWGFEAIRRTRSSRKHTNTADMHGLGATTGECKDQEKRIAIESGNSTADDVVANEGE